MSQASKNPNPPTPSAPATEATEATEASERRHRRLDLAKIALFYIHLYQWSYEEQQQMTAAIFAAMRATFLARWAELGLVGIPLPEAAAARLRKEASAAAAQITRTHNAALAQFIGQFTHSYAEQHPETLTSDGGALRAAITRAARAWIEQRSDWKPGQIAGQTTRLGLSLADLYADDGAGAGSALFTVDGPALTANSCPTCRTYYQQVIEQQQAWSLVFPAHPNCEHTLRQLTADERTLYELTGSLH